MTPLEKALNEPRGNYLTQADWMAGCIRAFLEAAAEDDASVARGREIIANGCGCHRDCDEPDSDGYCGCRLESKAAILALKETING